MESQLRPWLSSDELHRIDELFDSYGSTEPERIPALVADLVSKIEQLNDFEGINLYAGTNVMDPQARQFAHSTIGSRPSLGQPGNKYEMGLQHAEALEVLCLSLLRQVFQCAYAEFRVLSGGMANLVAYMALAQPGETILSLPERAGGHATHRDYGAAGLYGLRVVDIPWDDERMSVDLDRLAEVAGQERPRILLVGSSLMLFPFPLAEIRAIAERVGATVLYDAAHVSGLLAGRAFQRPLEEGAHLVTCSTYKSLGGPPGGLLLTNESSLAERIERIVYPGLIANFDLGRIAALTVALAGWLHCGADYAQMMCANAHALAYALRAEGLPVLAEELGFTQSHHVVLPAQAFGGGTHAARKLEESLLLTSGITVPGVAVEGDFNGLRLGTQEITRWGMQPEHMSWIAHAMADRLLGRRGAQEIRDEVRAFRGEFQCLHFVLA